MKLHRFIGLFDLSSNSITITNRELVNRLKNVLRFNVGDRFMVCDGNCAEAEVTITMIDQKSCLVKIEKAYQNNNEPKNDVRLFCSILKRANFELVVQKATEVGVAEITPIIGERTVKTNLNIKRLQTIAHEAAEQSGRGVVPVIHEPQLLKMAIANSPMNQSLNIMFDPRGDPMDLSISASDRRISAYVGPEGGWSPEELRLARSHNFQIASLGSLILRGETAAIIASYLCGRKNTKHDITMHDRVSSNRSSKQ